MLYFYRIMLENIFRYFLFILLFFFLRSNFVITFLSNVCNQTKRCTFPVVCPPNEKKNKATDSKSFAAQSKENVISFRVQHRYNYETAAVKHIHIPRRCLCMFVTSCLYKSKRTLSQREAWKYTKKFKLKQKQK